MSNKKIIHISTKMIPEWLNKDIERITKNGEVTASPSYLISRIYQQYTPSYRHIFAAMTGNKEWPLIARERLNYIDENIEFIAKHLKNRTFNSKGSVKIIKI